MRSLTLGLVFLVAFSWNKSARAWGGTACPADGPGVTPDGQPPLSSPSAAPSGGSPATDPPILVAHRSTVMGAGSVGGLYLPPGSNPGAAWGVLVEGDLVKAVGSGDYRVGAVLAYGRTYYSSATEAIVIGRANFDVGPFYSLGGGLGVGGGAFSARNGYNADTGGSLIFAALVTPMLLHFGPTRSVEVSGQYGIVRAVSFSNQSQFGGIFLGYVNR